MKTTIPSPKLTELLSSALTEDEALEIYDQGKDAVVWALLSLQKRVDELSCVNAPGEAMPSSPFRVNEKTQFGNRSESGTETQPILMSVFRSLKQRGINPSDAVKVALCQYAFSETIPSLNDVVNLIEAE